MMPAIKVHKHTKGPLATFATPDARFNQVASYIAIYHFDIMDSCTPTISIKASSTFWPDSTVSPVSYNPFAPLYSGITAKTVAGYSTLVSLFTVTIATDRARISIWLGTMEWSANVASYLASCKRIYQYNFIPTGSYNSHIEHFHHQLKTSLKTHPNPTGTL